MKTDLAREKALKSLGEALQKVGWTLSAMASAHTGLQDTGIVEEAAAHERTCEALEDLEIALEALGEVRDYLSGQVGEKPTASAAAC
jgi:hypothetical protein